MTTNIKIPLVIAVNSIETNNCDLSCKHLQKSRRFQKEKEPYPYCELFKSKLKCSAYGAIRCELCFWVEGTTFPRTYTTTKE